MKKYAIGSIIGIALLAILVISDPLESKSSPMTDMLRSWGHSQQTVSEKVIGDVVSGTEGVVTGERMEDGEQWSLPNIFNYWIDKLFGVKE